MTKYKAITPLHAFQAADGKLIDLYVYSTTNNPDGPDEGTYCSWIGKAQSLQDCVDLNTAAKAAADVLGYSWDSIGLAIQDPRPHLEEALGLFKEHFNRTPFDINCNAIKAIEEALSR
jgi:hypothetical protein